MSADHLLRILKPAVVRVSRQQPDRASLGDMVEMRVEPGLLDLLTSPVAGSGLPLGAGVLPEFLVCHGIAGTAAGVAIGETGRTHHAFHWTGVGLDLTWRRAAHQGEALVGRARVSEKRAMSLLVAVETASAETGEVIMTGHFQFVPVRDGRALLLEDSMLLFAQPDPEAARERARGGA